MTGCGLIRLAHAIGFVLIAGAAAADPPPEANTPGATPAAATQAPDHPASPEPAPGASPPPQPAPPAGTAQPAAPAQPVASQPAPQEAQPQPDQTPANPPTPEAVQQSPQQPQESKPETTPPKPSTEPVKTDEAVAVLGKKVRGPDGKDVMGPVIDVLVDGDGHPRAAIIDFGGFLGVGSRKIAVDWQSLKFKPGDHDAPLILTMDRAQIQAAPEYKESAPAAEVVEPPAAAPASPDAGHTTN